MPASHLAHALEDLLGGEQVDAPELVVVAPVAPRRAVRALLPALGHALQCTDRLAYSRKWGSRIQRTCCLAHRGGRTHDAEGLRRLGRRAPARAHRPVQDPPPEAPARPGGVGGGLRDRALRRGRRPGLPQAPHAGVRGLDGLAVPPDQRAHARGRPRASSSRTWTSTASTPRCCTRTCRCSGSSPTTTRCRSPTPGSTTTTSSSGSRRTSTGSRPPRPIPLTDIGDAVAEIERVAAGGFRAVLLPATAPMPYYRQRLDPVWAAVQATGMSVFIHTQTGGIKVDDPEALDAQGHDGERRSRSTSR